MIDIFVAKLSGGLDRLIWSTYIGGSGHDLIRSVAIGPKGEVYLVGSTDSPDFPATKGTRQPAFGGGLDAFIVKLLPVRE